MKAPKPYSRTERVGQQIQEILSEIHTQHIDLSHVGFVTFTHVTMSPDLHNAKVFFSVVQPELPLPQIEIELNKLQKAFRKYLGPELHLKVTPELRFYYDDSLAYQDRLDYLFERIHSTGNQE